MTDSPNGLEELAELAGAALRELEAGEQSAVTRWRAEQLEQIQSAAVAAMPTRAELALAELEAKAELLRGYRRAGLEELATKAGRYWQGSSYSVAVSSVTRQNLELAALEQLGASLARCMAEAFGAELRLEELRVADDCQSRELARLSAELELMPRNLEQLAGFVAEAEARGDEAEAGLERRRVVMLEERQREGFRTRGDIIAKLARFGLELEALRGRLADCELELGLLVDKADYAVRCGLTAELKA